MKRLVLIMLATIGLLGCTTTDAVNVKADRSVRVLDSADESAVRAVVAEFAKTWNRHDMKAMQALNTEDVEWINPAANDWRGSAAVYKGHNAVHRTVFAKTDMSVENIVARSIAPDVAIAVATVKVGPFTNPAGQVLSEMKSRASFVVAKRDSTWKIAHAQFTAVDAGAEKNDPLTWDEAGHSPGGKQRP